MTPETGVCHGFDTQRDYLDKQSVQLQQPVSGTFLDLLTEDVTDHVTVSLAP